MTEGQVMGPHVYARIGRGLTAYHQAMGLLENPFVDPEGFHDGNFVRVTVVYPTYATIEVDGLGTGVPLHFLNFLFTDGKPDKPVIWANEYIHIFMMNDVFKIPGGNDWVIGGVMGPTMFSAFESPLKALQHLRKKGLV